MKKAYLVTFNVTTRVVTDVPEDADFNLNDDTLDTIVNEAVDNIMELPYSYLYGENAEVKEDTECPYGEFEGD